MNQEVPSWAVTGYRWCPQGQMWPEAADPDHANLMYPCLWPHCWLPLASDPRHVGKETRKSQQGGGA